jgi:hypothetical protein
VDVLTKNEAWDALKSSIFKDAGSGKRGKPAHVHGVELRRELLEAAPSSVDALKTPP